jgi:hypothetical protein
MDYKKEPINAAEEMSVSFSYKNHTKPIKRFKRWIVVSMLVRIFTTGI